jgi:hypothetical protein
MAHFAPGKSCDCMAPSHATTAVGVRDDERDSS